MFVAHTHAHIYGCRWQRQSPCALILSIYICTQRHTERHHGRSARSVYYALFSVVSVVHLRMACVRRVHGCCDGGVSAKRNETQERKTNQQQQHSPRTKWTSKFAFASSMSCKILWRIDICTSNGRKDFIAHAIEHRSAATVTHTHTQHSHIQMQII